MKDQFILCKGKLPVDINGNAINPHDPAQWMSRVDAEAKAQGFGLGVGFVFTSDAGFWFLDLDHCLVDGKHTPIAAQLLEKFAGCYVETSTSGEGLHIFGRGTVPEHSCKNKAYNIELYHDKRFVLLTGTDARGSWDFQCSHLMHWLVDNFFPPLVTKNEENWRNTPIPEWSGPEDDESLIAKMLNLKPSAAQIFGNRASIKELFENTESALTVNYPPFNTNDPYDRSSADAALASHLAFWTGKNHERINRIMWQSALVRDKWTKHRSYLTLTIKSAVNRCTNVLNKAPPQTVTELEPSSTNPLSWTAEFKVSKEEADEISDPEWIIENLVISGHLIVIPAKPNGGKTTIFFHLSGEMVAKGYDVYYVNADISGGDAKSMIYEADEMGVELLLPDMKVGKSMDNVVTRLNEMNESPSSLSNVVFIFDTLKKMTDVIQKAKSKELYKLLRSLTSKGMTIVLLAHTNKYNDEEGNPIFEGTGDLRSDVDELIYLIPERHEDGTMTVSTSPDKVRGTFTPISYKISKDRDVTLLPKYIDTKLMVMKKSKMDKDRELIDAIDLAINDGHNNQKSIIDYIKSNYSYGVRIIRRVLGDYSKTIKSDSDVFVNHDEYQAWGTQKGEKNETIYTKLDIAPEGEEKLSNIARIVFNK